MSTASMTRNPHFWAAVEAITAPPARAPKRGAHLATLTVDLIDIDVTYNVEGGNYPATEYEQAESTYAVLVTATVGGVDITAWAARLDLDSLLDDYYASAGDAP